MFVDLEFVGVWGKGAFCICIIGARIGARSERTVNFATPVVELCKVGPDPFYNGRPPLFIYEVNGLSTLNHVEIIRPIIHRRGTLTTA